MTQAPNIETVAGIGRPYNNPLHHLSVTSIPRPISGTSRRASSSLFVPINNNGTSESRPESSSSPHPRRMSRAPQRNTLANESMPPSSFSFPRAMLPRSNSLLPYQDRPRIDLSGTQEQLPVKGLATRIVETSPQRTTQPPAHTRQITPRMLMRPIHPPLPRSQTTSNLSCFPGGHDVSPSKPPRKSSLANSLTRNDGTQIDVVDALLESRMTKPEIQLHDTVQKELLANRNRINSNSCIPPRRMGTSRSSASTSTSVHGGSSLILNLSVNDIANTKRLEEQHQTMNARRPLFINTKLANTARAQESSPLTYSTPGSGTTYSSISSTEPSPNIRHVYRAEGITYWTGRYVATTDCIRKADCEKLLKQRYEKGVDINSPSFENIFDRVEETRMTRVLEDLRGCCQSQDAIKSLTKFETQLKKRLAKPPPAFVRSYSDIFRKSSQEHSGRDKVDDGKTGVQIFPSNNIESQRPTFNAQATFEKLSGLVTRKGGLIKSKTTGDLTLKPISERAPTPGLTSLKSKCNEPGPRAQVQKALRAKPVSEARARAIQEREARPYIAVEYPNQASMDQSPIECSRRAVSNTQIVSIESVMNTRQPRSLHRAIRLDNIHQLSSAMSSCPPLADTTTNRPSINTNLNSGSSRTTTHGGTVQETILYQKPSERRGSGQRSGEFVKKVVGAGIREVRKMSRRVGSMGLSSSSDDLPDGIGAAEK